MKNMKHDRRLKNDMVAKVGLEPTRPSYEQGILSPLRLPISSLGQNVEVYFLKETSKEIVSCNYFREFSSSAHSFLNRYYLLCSHASSHETEK